MKNHAAAAEIAMPNTTPTTIPAIAPPDNPEEDEEADAEVLVGEVVAAEVGLAVGVGVVNDERADATVKSTVVVCPENDAQPIPTEPPS